MAGGRSSRASDTMALAESLGSGVRVSKASELYPAVVGKSLHLSQPGLCRPGGMTVPPLPERVGEDRQKSGKDLRTVPGVHNHTNTNHRLFPRLEGTSQRCHPLLGILVLTFGALPDFLLLSVQLPHSLSLSLPPIIRFPLAGQVSALPVSSCSHAPPPEACLSSSSSSRADTQALAPRCLQVKTACLHLALKALSEPASTQSSHVTPPFGSNHISFS